MKNKKKNNVLYGKNCLITGSTGGLGRELSILFAKMGINVFLTSTKNQSLAKLQKEIIKQNRVADHIWYISNTNKFKKEYPNWKQKYNTKKIIEELISNYN